MATVYPSLLAADQHNLEKIVKQLEPACSGFHIDIIDNKFAPNTGISTERTNIIAALTYRQIWVHLMVEEPESYLNQLLLPPDSIVTFHVESHKHALPLVKKITEKKWLPGIAIKPKTSVDEIFPLLDSLHQVLIMSVEPGFSGQPFLEKVIAKIDPLIGYRQTSRTTFKIAMDGGITAKNIRVLAQKGIDQFAVGSELFSSRLGLLEAYHIVSELAE